MRSAWTRLPTEAASVVKPEFDLAGFLAMVRDLDPLTFPETVELLPHRFRAPGEWRLVIADHPKVILWDGLCEPAAELLTRLFELQHLGLQPCHPALYQLAERRLELPAVGSLPVVARQQCWLTCTVSRGPTACLNSTQRIGYQLAVPWN